MFHLFSSGQNYLHLASHLVRTYAWLGSLMWRDYNRWSVHGLKVWPMSSLPFQAYGITRLGLTHSTFATDLVVGYLYQWIRQKKKRDMWRGKLPGCLSALPSCMVKIEGEFYLEKGSKRRFSCQKVRERERKKEPKCWVTNDRVHNVKHLNNLHLGKKKLQLFCFIDVIFDFEIDSKTTRFLKLSRTKKTL